MSRARLHRLPLQFLLIAIVATSVPVFAASLNGLTSAPLGAWNVPGGTGAPTVLTWASFTLRNNTKLDGQALEGGGSWIAQFGTWKATSNKATSNNVAFSNLTTSVGTVDAAAVATIDLGGNPHSGLVAMSDGTSFVFAQYDKTSGGQVRLYKYVSGTATLLTGVAGVGAPTVAPMRLDATTNTVKVSWNGAVVLTYALTPTEIGLFKSSGHTRFGLMANSDPTTTFDDFHVDT